MKMKTKTLDKLLLISVVMVVLLYVGSIFAVNIGGRGYVNFDIYSDAILAKYIAAEKTIFPEGWHFGNQIYTVATPVVSSLFYLLVGDSYLALALASCFMTILCVVSFLWCVKPFAKPKSIIIALLVLVGGTNIGLSAHGDMDGLQVFYTMASYYACYVIGIFATLGAYYRYLRGISVNVIVLCSVLVLNFALGMQSLRETLVLNLPLCMISLLEIIFIKRSDKKARRRYLISTAFMVAALLANIGGVMLNKLLVSNGTILQNDILTESSPLLWDNIVSAFFAFTAYIGLVSPTSALSLFEFTGALFSIVIVVAALVFVLFEHIMRKQTTIGNGILFFVVSLFAVFLAGILFISLRPMYYFCWYLLVSFCVIYLIEIEWKRHKKLLGYLKSLLVIGLLCISLVNYICTFAFSFKYIHETKNFYQSIAEQLNRDGIKYLYSDWRTERNMISTMSRDEIRYATLKFSGTPEDLWLSIDYLYMDSWFDSKNFENAYIILTDRSLHALETVFSPEYKEAFMSNIELVHQFVGSDITVYLYKGTEKMFIDMIE